MQIVVMGERLDKLTYFRLAQFCRKTWETLGL